MSDNQSVVENDGGWKKDIRASLNSQMRLWAKDVSPFGDALNIKPRNQMIAQAFGDAAAGDLEKAMTFGFVYLFSGMLGI